MKASETKIDRFLATSETTFAIPVYQRNYDWTIKECQQLFNDIIRIADSNDNAHFIGSIVYVHDDVYSATGLNELTIIDGQQRLTTITLIYSALYRLIKQMGNGNLVNRIQKMYLINEFAPETEKLKLKPTENNKEALRFILNSDGTDEFSGGYSRIIDNFNFFKNHINTENYETVLKGLSKLVFVDISLDRAKDNPQRIFESLNSTGLDLSQADLIRNYILMGLKQREQNNIYKNYWEIIERNAKEETLNISMVSDFIRDFLTLKNKEIPNKKDVYFKFKQKYPTTTVDELEIVLSELKSLVKFYNKLLNPKNETDAEIRRQLKYINQLEINVAYPFLMKVYEDCSNQIIGKQTFIAILELIQSFVWRRFIVGLPTNALNKIFMSLYEKIDIENYLFSVQKKLLEMSRYQRFPKNSEVSNFLKGKDVYNIKTKNRTYFFERLENYKNNEPVVIEGNEKITVEHIFPQNPDPKWKIELGEEEYAFIKENYLNTIGNLTLSGNNGKLSNKPFVEKRDMNIDGGEQGYKFSRLWLNSDLKEKEIWNKAEIENRTQAVTERFLHIWQYPDIQIENIYENDEINIFDADDSNGRKIRYYILFGQRTDVSSARDFYISVFKQLFELSPELFFTTSLRNRIITADSINIDRLDKDYGRLNDAYYLYVNIVNSTKFDRIKEALTILNCEDELTIKYEE
jgi:uncharacterized protein with ParB-like and HNH nuclease domain